MISSNFGSIFFDHVNPHAGRHCYIFMSIHKETLVKHAVQWECYDYLMQGKLLPLENVSYLLKCAYSSN